MPISVQFRDRVTQLVDDCDCTRNDLRAELKISSTAFTNAINYGIIPTPKTLIKIADYFEVSLCFLLGKSASNEYIPPLNKSSFCKRFTLLCEEKSITRYRVSADCGFDHSLIVRWFNKGYLPSLEILEILCDYFKVSPDYLLGRSDFKN